MLRNGLISIVDDDDAFRESILGFVRSAGFVAQGFASAEEFLTFDLAATHCLTLDVSMPGMSGLDLQSELRARRLQIPIIFITAHGDERTRARALREGALACLPKPFDGEELLRLIETALGESR